MTCRILLPVLVLGFATLACQSQPSAASEGDPVQGNEQTGTAIVEVVTEPEAVGDSLTFAGTPAGTLVLQPEQSNTLIAEALAVGSYSSTLVEMGPELTSQGYALESIACDDPSSPSPSVGDINSRAASFNVDEGETVTCVFKLVVVPCICPLEGSWTASNFPGTMTCAGSFNMTMPLAPSTETGALQILDGCQSVFATDFGDDTADITMHQAAGCTYEGTVGGSQDGIPMEIHFTWHLQSERLISGSLFSQVEHSGATCTMERAFELRYND